MIGEKPPCQSLIWVQVRTHLDQDQTWSWGLTGTSRAHQLRLTQSDEEAEETVHDGVHDGLHVRVLQVRSVDGCRETGGDRQLTPTTCFLKGFTHSS